MYGFLSNLISESLGKSEPISVKLNSILCSNIEANRKLLFPIVDTIVFCGRMSLPLRGHRDSSSFHPSVGDYSTDNNVGLFVELLNFRVRAGDLVLKNHLTSSPKNASYISKTTQNNLIQACGDIITETLISKVKEARFFSIIADECSDCSNTEQLALCLRFVDKELNIHEKFLKFCELKNGLTGKAIAHAILSCIENDLKLDIMNCRGQSYDGAGSMSGRKNGCFSQIQSLNNKAIYTHCFSHRLNLSVMKACSDQGIRNFLDTVGMITYFFNSSPKRQLCLEDHIEQNNSYSKDSKKKLKDVCRTRWVERIYALDTFQELLPAIASSLEEMKFNVGHKYYGDTPVNADNYFHRLTSFDFLVKLVVVRSVFYYTLDATVLLQSRKNDIADGFSIISSLKSNINSLVDQVDKFHDSCYEQALKLAKLFNTSESKPRCSPKLRSMHRANPPAETPKSYYRITVTKVLLDYLHQELDLRFSDSSLLPYKGLYIIPNKLLSYKDSKVWKTEFLDFAEFYKDDFPNFLSLDAELNNWEKHWKIFKGEIPENVQTTLMALPYPGFENIKVALRILATLPITSNEAERSFSAMKRLKTFTRSMMGNDRLNGLALLHIHKDIVPDPYKVIQKYAETGPRRLEIL